LSKNPGCLGFLLGQKTKEHEVDKYPYRLRDDFLSRAELSFYKVLLQITGDSYTVCPKVSLSDIFFVKGPEKTGYFNKISRKHVDFLLCEKETMKPVMGIELDDSSHQRKKRQERDVTVNHIFEAAGFPLARVRNVQSYNLEDLKHYLFNEVLKGQPEQGKTDNTEASKAESDDDTDEVMCPKCGIPMVIRKSRRGNKFYGCSNYPRCLETRSFTEYGV